MKKTEIFSNTEVLGWTQNKDEKKRNRQWYNTRTNWAERICAFIISMFQNLKLDLHILHMNYSSWIYIIFRYVPPKNDRTILNCKVLDYKILNKEIGLQKWKKKDPK